MQGTVARPAHPGPPPLPTTFGGVAAVACRPAIWLAAWQLITAATISTLLVAGLDRVWGEPIRRAAAVMPEDSGIRNGVLVWPDRQTRILVESPFLAIVVDPSAERTTGTAADVTVALESHQMTARSFLGRTGMDYQGMPDMSLGGNRLLGLIAAWERPFLWILGVSLAVALVLCWAALATLYTLPLLLLARAVGRVCAVGTAWKLAAASLIPGAALMTMAAVLYATRQIPLVGLLLAVPGHLILGWCLALGGAFRLPRRGLADSNPFSSEPTETDDLAEPPPKRNANPFQVL